MKRYEYTIHYMALIGGKSKEQQVLEALNHFGEEGWRLNRMYGDIRLRSLLNWRGGLNLILEREATS
jgi:hypothetical protein